MLALSRDTSMAAGKDVTSHSNRSTVCSPSRCSPWWFASVACRGRAGLSLRKLRGSARFPPLCSVQPRPHGLSPARVRSSKQVDRWSTILESIEFGWLAFGDTVDVSHDFHEDFVHLDRNRVSDFDAAIQRAGQFSPFDNGYSVFAG